MITRTVARRVYATVARLILPLMTVFGISGPAAAHETVSDQSPHPNETLPAGIVELSLNFTGELLVLRDASGIEIEITDPEGNTFRLADLGCLKIGNESLGATLDLDISGEYLVVWQATASDGHAMSESFSFSVENSNDYQSSQTLGEQCDGNLLPDGSTIGGGGTSMEGNGDSEVQVSSSLTPDALLWTIAVAFALVAATVAMLVFRSSKRGRAKSH